MKQNINSQGELYQDDAELKVLEVVKDTDGDDTNNINASKEVYETQPELVEVIRKSKKGLLSKLFRKLNHHFAESILFIGISLAIIVFAVTPVATVFSIDPVLTCRVNDLQQEINYMIDWAQFYRRVNYLYVVVDVLNYYGDIVPEALFESTFALQLIDQVKDDAPANLFNGTLITYSWLQYFIDFLDAEYASTTTLLTSTTYSEMHRLAVEFQQKTFLLFQSQKKKWNKEVTNTMKEFNQFAELSVADLYSPFSIEIEENTVAFSALLEQAYTSCFSLSKCWSGSAKSFLDKVSSLSTRIMINLQTILITQVNDAIDPKGNATTVNELIVHFQNRSANRLALLRNTSEMMDTLSTLLKGKGGLKVEHEQPNNKDSTGHEENDFESDYNINDGDNADDGHDNFLFSVNDLWSANLLYAIEQFYLIVDNLNLKFNNSISVEQWISNDGLSVLHRQINVTTLMGLGRVLNSYFAYNINGSLDPRLSDSATNNAIDLYKRNKVNMFFNKFLSLIYDHFQSSVTRASQTNNLCTHSLKQEGWSVTIACIFSCAAAFCLYVIVAYVVRYYVKSSPFPFTGVLLTLLFLFVVHCVVSVMFVLITKDILHHKWEINQENTNNVITQVDLTTKIGKLLSTGLRLSLLVASDLNTTKRDYTDLINNFTTLSREIGEVPWMKSANEFFKVLEEYFEGGINAIYQQFTATLSGPTTLSAVLQELNLSSTSLLSRTNLGYHENNVDQPCQGEVASAAITTLINGYLNSLYLNLKIAAQRIYGVSEICTNDTTTILQQACEVALLADKETKHKENECYVSNICSYPSTFGLLNSVCDGKGIYSLISSNSISEIGSLIKTWNNTLSGDLPARSANVLASYNVFLNTDSDYIINRSRLVF